MSNLLKKILAFFRNLFHKTQAAPTPEPATPVAPAPVAPPVEAPKPATTTVSDATRAAEASGETFAQFIIRAHPELINQLSVYTMAASTYASQGLTNEQILIAIQNGHQPVPPADTPVFTHGTPTSANLLQPLTGPLLEVVHSIKNTDTYMAAVATFKQAGYSDADIAGYINAYSPGGMWYGK